MCTGMKVGRLRVIFTLPEILRNFHTAPTTWPSEHLAYVEWYKISDRPGTHHNMYIVSKPHPLPNNILPGDIIPLRAIRQSCQLIPLTGPNATWSRSWTTSNVLDECSSFLLNNWTSKYAYQTIW
jgi:hypothetical protein